MSFDKFVTSFFKEDPIRKELKKINLYSEDHNEDVLAKSMQYFHQKQT